MHATHIRALVTALLSAGFALLATAISVLADSGGGPIPR